MPVRVRPGAPLKTISADKTLIALQGWTLWQTVNGFQFLRNEEKDLLFVPRTANQHKLEYDRALFYLDSCIQHSVKDIDDSFLKDFFDWYPEWSTPKN